MAERREGEPPQISSTTEAVENLINGNVDGVIEYLKSHPEEVSELCMQTYESYGEKSREAGIVQLSILIERLLK